MNENINKNAHKVWKESNNLQCLKCSCCFVLDAEPWNIKKKQKNERIFMDDILPGLCIFSISRHFLWCASYTFYFLLHWRWVWPFVSPPWCLLSTASSVLTPCWGYCDENTANTHKCWCHILVAVYWRTKGLRWISATAVVVVG